MGLTRNDVVEGYFQDYNHRLTRFSVEAAAEQQPQVSLEVLAQGAGQVTLSQSVEVEQ
jgi:hypothetical protein